MTPEEVARFVLSDGQDPAVRAKVEREMDEQLAEAMLDPVFKARWDASMRELTDRLDDKIAAQVYAALESERIERLAHVPPRD